MSACKDPLVIGDDASDERLALVAEILAKGEAVVILGGVLVLRSTKRELMCEVIDPAPSAHRCSDEYEVLLENAQRALDASKLRDVLPHLPRKWLVVEDEGTSSVQRWPAP